MNRHLAWIVVGVGFCAAPVSAQVPDAGVADGGETAAEKVPGGEPVMAPPADPEKVPAPQAVVEAPVLALASPASDVALYLGVESDALDLVESVTKLREGVERGLASKRAERDALESQRSWAAALAKGDAPEAGHSPQPGVEPEGEGPSRDPGSKARAVVADGLKAASEGARPSRAEPDPAARVQRELAARAAALERRVTMLDQEIARAQAALAWLEQRQATLASSAAPERDARVLEAEDTRAEVEKQRVEAAADTDQAAEDLARLLAEQESSEEALRALNAEDIRVRSEQLYLLGRVVEELPAQIKSANREMADLATYRKEVAAELAEISRRIDDRDKPELARSDALRRYEELEKRQSAARNRSSSLQRLLAYTQGELLEVERLVTAAGDDVAVRRDAATAAVEDRRKGKALSVAQGKLRRAEARRTVLDLRRRLYSLQLAVALDEAAFCKRTRLGMLNLLPEARLADERAVTDENLAAGRDEIADLVLEGRQLLLQRAAQVRELPSRALSLAGIWWLMKAVLLIAFLVVAVRRLREQHMELVTWLSDRILSFRWWRQRRPQAMRVVQVLAVAIAPLTALGCVYVLLWLFPAGAPEVVALGAVAKAAILYWLAIVVLRTVILPQWYRESGEVPADDSTAARELEQARFLLATLQLMLTYTIACQVTLYFVREGLGLLFVGYWVHVLGYLGYAVVIYLLLSRWRETIAQIFAQRIGDQSPKARAFVALHKDRFYGILVVFGAFLYVAVTVSVQWGRRHLERMGAVRRVRNFLFRRRIEMEQRLDKDRATTVPSGEVPQVLRDQFDIRRVVSQPLEREELSALVDLVHGWHRPGRPGVIHVVGERGMGKTTVLLGLGALLGERVLRWSVRERVSASTDLSAQVAALFGVSPVGDLATQLLAEPPRVVIVDDAHRLFLRRIGGFAALSELERLMVATGEHHFWVLAHDAWAWRYLRLRQRRALQGPSVITLRAWSALELRSWVTARTESAGFEVSFAQLDDDASSTEQGRSAGGYFSLLEEAAQGNPWCAGELWLAALSVEDGTAHVGLFSQKAAAQLRGVTDEGRFLLAALVQHDGLGAREVAEVLGVSVSGAQELLLDLVERGLVERGPDGIEHVVTRAAYRETVAFVRGHNLLHTGGAQ